MNNTLLTGHFCPRPLIFTHPSPYLWQVNLPMLFLYRPNQASPLKKIKTFKTAGLVLVLHVCFALPAMAQYDSLLHKPYKENVLGIHAMYKGLIDIKDSMLRAQKAEEIKSFARKHNDRRLELNVDFFLNFWNAFYQPQPKKISLKKLTEQVKSSAKENIDFLYPRSLRALAEFYWKIEKNYELAFEQYLLLDKELADTNPADYPEMARDLMQIGEAFYFFQDYALAKKYFKRAIALPENSFNTVVINTARNNLGLCYQHENMLDSSDYYFKAISESHFPEADKWKQVAAGNLGANKYMRRQYSQAIPLLEADYRRGIAEKDYGCSAGAAIILADIYRQEGKPAKAETYITAARQYIDKAEQPYRLRLLYPVMSKWYAAAGDKERTVLYLDSAIWALNRYNEKFSALKVLKAQQNIDLQKEKLQQTTITLERERKAAERNLLILLVCILCITTALTYFIQKKRQLAKGLKLQKASQELETARLNLDKFTERIHEKNKLIEKLEQKLDNNTGADNNIIQQLRQSTILTEDDWLNFKSLFEEVHAGFLHRLKEKYPSFSPAEIRFVSLAKLNFSTKEMSAALGVSPQSIRTNWYRIRKKLALDDTLTLDDLVAEI